MGLKNGQAAIAVGVAILMLIGFAPAGVPTTDAVPAATRPAATRPAEASAEPAHTVTRGSIPLVFRGLATFEPVEPFEVRPRPEAYKGELKIVAASANGADVTAGDVLLEFDATDLTRSLAAAENERVSAAANLQKAQADAELGAQADALALQIHQVAVKNAEGALAWWEQVEGPHMLKRSELSVRMATASVEDQDDELDQLRKMYKDEELTSATADIVVKRAVRALDISKQQLEIARASAEKVKAFDHAVARQRVVDALAQAKQQLAQLEATQQHAKVARAAATTTAELASAAAERKVAELKADLAAMTIKAPFDGRVIYGSLGDGAWQGADPRTLRAGEKIAAGTTALTVVAPGRLRASVDVPEAKLAWLAPGMKAILTPVAWPELKLPGRIAAPAPAGKGGGADQTFKLAIDLDAPPGDRLSPGMKAHVRIDAGHVSDVLVLPASAVTSGTVRVRGDDGTVQERDVTVGRSDGNLIEIREGLSAGDKVMGPVPK